MALNRRIATRDENFGDAARFDPERWLVDDAERACPHDTGAFLPFGAGPRFCPGRNLAVLQIRTVLAMLCRNFDVERAGPDAERAVRGAARLHHDADRPARADEAAKRSRKVNR